MKRILLTDFSAISHATFHIALNDKFNETEDDVIGFWRHTILNSILVRKNKINPDEVVFGIDYGSWRSDFYDKYKSDRKRQKAMSNIDYTFFLEASKTFISEIKENFPWKIIQNKYCEGDDIIGILAYELCKENEVIILSSDKDLQQLTVLPNVKFYSYRDDEFKDDVDSEYLLRHTIIGDKSDSIPSVLGELRYTKKFKNWIEKYV